MTRYFITELAVEGFRGINNEGDPLRLRLRTDAVNSIFAPNAQGKSSVYEALCYAIKGEIPKLSAMHATEHADEYYANRFHSGSTATILLTLANEDLTESTQIRVQRLEDGTRAVDSPTGHADPEQLLSSLDDDLCLLDHRTFERFVDDTPLRRGRTFSRLLGLGEISETRQALEVLALVRTTNRDLEVTDLRASKQKIQRDGKEAVAAGKTAFKTVTGQDWTAKFVPAQLVDAATTALRGVPLLEPFLATATVATVDFEQIRQAIRTSEGGEQRDQLATTNRSLLALEGLSAAAGEGEELGALRTAVGSREAALRDTRGDLLRQLYQATSAVLDSPEWEDPSQCPACESTLASELEPRITERLSHYAQAESATAQVRESWASAAVPSRVRRLLASTHMPANATRAEAFTALDRTFEAGAATTEDCNTLDTLITDADAARRTKVAELQAEKARLEGLLPPSLVALTEQVGAAEELALQLQRFASLGDRFRTTSLRLKKRLYWAKFVALAAETFAQAEVALSTEQTLALEESYQEMYALITQNPDVVPRLAKSDDKEELHLRLERFYGLEDLAAPTLLSESYRNALAMSIFLSATLRHAGSARYVVLDDVTSSFDAGHQFALMELIRTAIGLPENASGPQVIMFSHDGLLEKYFDRLSGQGGWHHQRLQGLSPHGAVFAQHQAADRLRASAERFLGAGQVSEGEPLVRQYLEYTLLRIIRSVKIPVPVDFSIKDDRHTAGNCTDAIMAHVRLMNDADHLVLDDAQYQALDSVLVPSLIANWISHYSTGVGTSFTPHVLLGVLNTIDQFSDCFKYDCGCQGGTQRRFYRNATSKRCPC